MAKRLFVGSLPYSTRDEELKQLFEKAGTVESASVIMDRASNRSKGFGFVEMATEDEAAKAVQMLNGTDMGGRTIVVSEARPREERPSRF